MESTKHFDNCSYTAELTYVDYTSIWTFIFLKKHENEHILMYTDKHLDAVDLEFLVTVERAYFIFRLHFCVLISFVHVFRDILFCFFSLLISPEF